MSHNAYIRAAGVWNPLTDLLSTEMATFDARQFKSINGDDGGSWSPAAALVLGGAGLWLTGGNVHHVMNAATLNLDNGATLLGAVGSQATFHGGCLVDGTFTISALTHVTTGTSFIHDAGSVATFNCAPTFALGGSITTGALWTMAFATGSSMAFAGASTVSLNGTTSFTANTGTFIIAGGGSTMQVATGATFTISTGATAQIQAPLVLSSKGAIRQRFTVVGSATSIDVNDIDEVRLLSGTGGYTLAFTGTPAAGMKVRVQYAEITSPIADITVTIGVVTLAFNSATAGKVHMADFVYDHINTAWIVSMKQVN